MRSLRNVSVKEAIIHILIVEKDEEDEKQGGRKRRHKTQEEIKEKIISERTVNLQDNIELRTYFEDLITKASEDGAARAAVFADEKVNEPLKRCRTMFKDEAAFTAGSVEFSNLFHLLMEADHRIKDGNLVVCRFTAESTFGNRSLVNEFLAILKLLPVGAYRNVQKLDAESGKKFIDMEVDPLIFLNDNNVLQKVALIRRPPFHGSDEQVLILDKQYKHGEVAQFFKKFLGIALVRDPAELTLNLYTCLIHSLNHIRADLTPELDSYLGSRIYEIFSKNGIETLTNKLRELELYDWVDRLKDVPQAVKSWFEQGLKDEFKDSTAIKLDLSLVARYVRRRSFSGQEGSTYHLPTSGYDNLVQSVRYVTDVPGVTPYYEVTIHTSVWREETNK